MKLRSLKLTRIGAEHFQIHEINAIEGENIFKYMKLTRLRRRTLVNT